MHTIEEQLESKVVADSDPAETQDWIEAFDDVLRFQGSQRGVELIRTLISHARSRGVNVNPALNTPYSNTVRPADQTVYPGDLEIEKRITALVRWNALAMVLNANSENSEVGAISQVTLQSRSCSRLDSIISSERTPQQRTSNPAPT